MRQRGTHGRARTAASARGKIAAAKWPWSSRRAASAATAGTLDGMFTTQSYGMYG